MSRIIAIEHLTLDGVMQAPGRADEDTRDGFDYGGWARATDDPEMQKVIGKSMLAGWSLLTGVQQPAHPVTQALTNVQKFVISRDPGYKLSWANSILLAGDAAETVSRLKKEHDKTLIIFGSGLLVRSLMPLNLIDEYISQIHPLVLGKGRCLFEKGSPFTKARLTDFVTTDTSVIIATYQPVSKTA